MEKPLVDIQVMLEKFPGKGGWTFARVPEIKPDKKNWFNWVKVKGSIDDYTFNAVNLMPMGDGRMFLPVKKEVRKIIKKEAGDSVHIILFKDNDPVHIPGELLDCLRDEPKSHNAFLHLPENEQTRLIKWIYSAKLEHTRAERIAELVDKLYKVIKPEQDSD